MKAAEMTMSYGRMIECGGGGLYEERHLKNWWGERDELSVSEIVNSRMVPLSRILWACFHLPSPPEKAFLKAGLAAATEYLRRAKQTGIYVDLRSEFALAKKGAWMRGEISLGELKDAKRRARAALHDIAELSTDPRAVVVANALVEAANEQASVSLRSFHYSIENDPLSDKGSLVRDCLVKAVHEEEVMS